MDQRFPWYDSFWLCHYVAAQTYLRGRRPDKLRDFLEALAPLKTRRDFQVQRLPQVLDDRIVSDIRDLSRSLPLEELELHEMAGFGSFVVHNQPALAQLQASTVKLVSELAGEAAEPSYSFLSIYTKLGRCPMYMDAPVKADRAHAGLLARTRRRAALRRLESVALSRSAATIGPGELRHYAILPLHSAGYERARRSRELVPDLRCAGAGSYSRRAPG
jgi:hypothetical protein